MAWKEGFRVEDMNAAELEDNKFLLLCRLLWKSRTIHSPRKISWRATMQKQHSVPSLD